MTSVVSNVTSNLAAEAVTSVVGEATSNTASIVSSNVSAGGLKGAIAWGKNLLMNAPMSAFVKFGVVVGLAAFTGYVMIKRHRKQDKYREQIPADGTIFTDYQRTTSASPVDVLLGKGYTSNPDTFSAMDPAAQLLADEIRPAKKRKVRKPSKKRKAQIRQSFDAAKAKEARKDETVCWARGVTKSMLDEVDAIAEELGLPTYWKVDDDIPLDVRERYKNVLF